jgi:hypothetical protein
MGIPRALSVKTTLKLTLLCLLVAVANVLLSALAGRVLHLSLFLDTLFTVAITFAAGLVPGIAVAVLSGAITVSFYHEAPVTCLFTLCSIAEAVLVWTYRRRPGAKQEPLISTAASLLLLYLAAAVVISVLGGIVDYVIFTVQPQVRINFTPEDSFKLGLLRNNIPLLRAGILSRIPVNLVDRFVSIFGGYGVSRLIVRFLRPAVPCSPLIG